MKPSTHNHILVACAALALAAPAAQAGPLGGHTSQAEPVIGKVTRSRHVVAVTPAYDQKCQAGGDAFSWTQFRPAKLTKRHTFATRGSSRDTFDDGYAIAETYRVSGKVTKSGVRGTFQVHDKWYAPDGSVDDVCDTGKVSFRISDPNVLAGKTSDGAPSVLELGSARTQIKSLLIPWTADCKSGESMWNTARLSGPLQATGAFAASLTPPSFDWGDGRQATQTEELNGHLTRSGASGTWHVQATIADAGGAQVDTCDSGIVHFALS